VSGPSGVGKGTIVRRLLDREPRLWFSISATTRPRRADEVDGRDYFFLDREEFERLRDADGFLEWFDVYGDLKGTPRAPVEDHLGEGDVLLEVDVQGALAVREAYPEAVLVFVKAPSHDEQRRRLVERGEDDRDAIERRLARAHDEEALAERFDTVVVNDDPNRAADELAAILRSHREARTPPEPGAAP
jgi:guanylate kinase